VTTTVFEFAANNSEELSQKLQRKLQKSIFKSRYYFSLSATRAATRESTHWPVARWDHGSATFGVYTAFHRTSPSLLLTLIKLKTDRLGAGTIETGFTPPPQFQHAGTGVRQSLNRFASQTQDAGACPSGKPPGGQFPRIPSEHTALADGSSCKAAPCPKTIPSVPTPARGMLQQRVRAAMRPVSAVTRAVCGCDTTHWGLITPQAPRLCRPNLLGLGDPGGARMWWLASSNPATALRAGLVLPKCSTCTEYGRLAFRFLSSACRPHKRHTRRATLLCNGMQVTPFNASV
jgi:hypothetical protein